MSRKIETVYESHKEKYLTRIETTDKNGRKWWISERHKEETPNRELLYELNDKLGAKVREANDKEFIPSKYDNMV